MPSGIPDRVRWAVEVLEIEPGDRLLEIGCGRGQAVELVAARLDGGQITGLDRSARAIAAATARNQQQMAAGKVKLMHSTLAGATFHKPFDKVFAVNVNVFWLGSGQELALLRAALAPEGSLFLFYEPPSADQLERIRTGCGLLLERAGFAIRDILTSEFSSSHGLCIVAQAAPS
jgi:SAM-dependent methyltransferase